MKISKKTIGFIFGSLSIACLIIGYFILYKAGCAGDSKGGSYGNPKESLEIESLATPFIFAASIFLAVSFGISTKNPPLVKILIVSVLAVLIFFVFLFLGMNIEEYGIRATFN